MVYDSKLIQISGLQDLQKIIALGEYQKARQTKMKSHFNSSNEKFNYFSHHRNISHNFL